MARTTKVVNNLYEERDKEDGIMGDVTFIVEGKRIRAHRYVLAAVSEKYKAQFFGPKPDEGDIQVNGVSAAAFEEFLKLFYFDDVELSIEHIGNVLDLAKQSLNDDFVNECNDFLKRKMTIDNLCSIYRLANAYDIKELKDSCEEKISTDTEEWFASEDFINCDQQTLTQILQLNSFSCSESEVFDACISWARADCDRNQIDGSKAANLRAALGNAIVHIRFGSMTLNEFATRHKLLEGFFTLEESNEIMYIIAKLDGFQSQNFNGTQREQTRRFLECNRVAKQLQPPVEYNGWNGMTYYCSKQILVHGFRINSDSVNEVDVEIAEPGQHWKMRSVSIKKLNNEIEVTFVEPLDVEPGKWYYLRYKPTDSRAHMYHQTFTWDNIFLNGTKFGFEMINNQHSFISSLLFTPK